MKQIIVLIFLALSAYALEVVINPYQSIQYDQINAYDLNMEQEPCVCWCE